MTDQDRELLEDCLAAFDAVTTEDETSQLLLRKWGVYGLASYIGSGSWLAKYMARRLREHLADNKPEAG